MSKRILCIFHTSKQNLSRPWSFCLGLLTIYLVLMCGVSSAQTALPSSDTLKRLSLEELMNIEIKVTSVSKRPEKLAEVASAIQVITGEDIRRSGATNLPEALRLVSNLQIEQVRAYASVISARGFNAIFANKLLVMIDGRTVYSPLFAGVFWDAQSVLLEDIDRIEVISGPGGTLWGANAVNGVINIITKKAGDTQGLYVAGAAGTFVSSFGAIRYGGKIDSNLFYRIYIQQNSRSNTFLADGKDNADKWGLIQGGGRMDWKVSKASRVMVEGNFYGGIEHTLPSASSLDGQNVLALWTHTFSERSELKVQAYFDRTWRRDIPSTISDELKTYDFEFQHNFSLRKRHNILWGGGYRFMQDNTLNSTIFVGFLPAKRNMEVFNGFVQDEIILMPDQLNFTIGTKLQHNVFSGFEIQPSARLLWTPSAIHAVWGAISRAIRAPSRIDVDYYIPTYPVPPGQPNVAGGPNFKSETLLVYELGYRFKPISTLFLSLATFYNQYDDLYSVEALPGTQTYQIQNGTEGHSYGIEFSGNYQIMKNWRLRGGYTYFFKNLENKPGHVYDFSDLGNDAKHQMLLHSIMNLPENFQFDVTMRYISKLPDPFVPDYFTFDARLAWMFKEWGELSVVGQNLWEKRHMEFADVQIPRGVYGKVACRF